MKRISILRALTILAIIVGGAWVTGYLAPDRSILAASDATITITQPDGANDTLGQGDDFATTVLGDPWDMSEPTDIMTVNDLPNVTFSGGVLTYNTPTSVGSGGVPLLFGHGSQVDAGKIGALFPIDTSRYHWLSFRIRQPSGTSITAIWHTTDEYFFNEASTQSIPVTASGWQTYVINLSTYPKASGAWTGQVKGLYIQSNTSPGAQVSIDWVRLTANNPSSNSLPIAWSGLSPSGSSVDFYVDDDTTGCDGPRIHTQIGAAAGGSFSWGQTPADPAFPASFVAGKYYVCAKVGGSLAGYSAGQLTIDQMPLIQITQPSFTSGDDFATDAGNPWDMSDAADVFSVRNGAGVVQAGILAVTVPREDPLTPNNEGDVNVYLNLPADTAIQSDRYYYLTYRLRADYPYKYYTDNGQFTRIFWGQYPFTETQSKLIYVFSGWQAITVDLRSIATSFGPAWNTTMWTLFRLDPIANLTGQATTFYLDDVKLTGDERADRYADIQWRVTDPDSPLTTMRLYTDTNRSGFDSVAPIVTLQLTNGQYTLAAEAPGGTRAQLTATGELTRTVYLPVTARNYRHPCSGACYTWPTSSIAPGTYYIYACLDDGHNQICRYSESPLIISHP